MWIDGFERAMQLRPDAWKETALSDDEAAAAVCAILALNDIFYGPSTLTEEAEDELDWLAPELIPEFVANLYAWTKTREMDRRAASAAGFPGGVHGVDPLAFGRAVVKRCALPLRLRTYLHALLRCALSAPPPGRPTTCRRASPWG